MQVTLQGVTHRFGDGPMLFQPVDAILTTGELVAITGPSGSGKSTLLAILGGLISPSQGQVRYAGTRTACWIAQHPHGVPRRSTIDHVRWPFLARGSSEHEATHEASRILAQFGLLELASQPFGTLSGGQAQRLMLARGVAARPAILLVDEPTAQLDQDTASHVDAVLGTLTHGEQLVFVATHNPSTQAACDRTLTLAHA